MSAPSRLKEQREAADPGLSAWVSANAGSGKTAVLVDRIVRLLLGGAEPARLLCLTYTRTAAAEMNERLNQRLGAWATMPLDRLRAEIETVTGASPSGTEIARARSLFALALETPGGLKIQTIHAFCEALLGRFPLEAGVPARFTVLDDRTAGELADGIRERILARAAAEEGGPLAAAVARIGDLGGDGAIDAMFSAFKGARRAWLALPEDAAEGERRARLYARLGLRPDDTEEAVRAEVMTYLERFDLRRLAAALRKGGARASQRGEVLTAALEAPEPVALMVAVETVCLKKSDGEPIKDPLDAAAKKADSGAEQIVRELTDSVLALKGRLDAAFVADATAHVYALGDLFFRDYDRAKRLQGLLDYDDLIDKAEALLTGQDAAAWVLFKLDGGIDHVLIDEAQDTSPQQWNIVRALADEFFAGEGRDAPGGAHRPRTVFAVGDPKQSIFSFQGADPKSFLTMRDEMAAKARGAGRRFERVPLLKSFRTAAPPLNLVDAVFAAAGMRDGVAEEGETIRHLVHRANAAGRVELWPYVPASKRQEPEDYWTPLDAIAGDDPRRVLGARIARRIAAMIADKELLVSQGRPIEPGDVMILVRRRDALAEEIIRQLKNLGVAVSGSDRLQLSSHMAVQDLLALGQFALNADDDLNLGGLLKSPLVGLSEERLFELAYGREGRLWAALRARRDEPAFAAAYAQLSRIEARAGATPPFEFFAHELGPKGARENLLARLGEDADDPIDEFLNLAQAYELEHAPSLQGFIDWFQRGGTEIKRDLDRGGGMVRVMTVHGAKGLEAGVVILPDTCQTPSSGNRTMLLNAGGGVLIWAVDSGRDEAVRKALKAERKAAEMREYRRLLYVALTRAQDRLIVCGAANGKYTVPQTGSWYAAVEAGMKELGAAAEPFGDGQSMLTLSSPQKEPPSLRAAAVDAPSDVPMPAWAKAGPAPPAALDGEAPSRPSAPRISADASALALGRAVHDLLMRLGGLETAPPLEAAVRWAEAAGAAPDAAAEAAQQALAIRSGADFQDIFGPGSRGEIPFDVWLPQGGRLSGRFDRIVVTEKDVRVVEFKTAQRPPAGPAGVPPDQARQLGQYVRAARILFPGRTVHAELIWTAGPRRMAIGAQLLEEWSRLA
jgi:ATP-dependent helicase/nuclease subunit A